MGQKKSEESKEVERNQSLGWRNNWTVYDSPLEIGNVDIAGTMDFSFESSFLSVLPGGERFRKYIENELVTKELRIGVEFGGPGSALFLGFTDGFFSRSAGITLGDRRTADIKTKDAKRNHFVLEGDITQSGIYANLMRILGSEKVDLILARLKGGWNKLPVEPYTIAGMFERWYQMLNEGGLMFSEVPRLYRPLAVRWLKLLKQEKGLEIQTDFTGEIEREHDSTDVFRIKKLHGAPEKLPLLDPRTVREISKKSGSRRGII